MTINLMRAVPATCVLPDRRHPSSWNERTHMTNQIPVVSYLRLGEEPVLVAQQCTGCGARYFDRRNGCAGCEVREFTEAELERTGEVKAFTIVSHAAPGIPVPFVAA